MMKFQTPVTRTVPFGPATDVLHRSCLIVSLLLSVALGLSAAPVEYEGSYNPAENPQDRFAPDHTTGGNTDADPVWKWNLSNNPPSPTIEEIDGVWTFLSDTTVNDSYGSSWGVGQGQTNPTAWRADSMTGSTVDVRLQVIKGAFAIRVGNELGYYIVNFRPDEVILQGTSKTDHVHYVDIDNTFFHTYRIALKDGQASLYVDDNEIPLFSEVDHVPNTKLNNLLFGDITASTGGRANLTHISWTNAEAEFSAPLAMP